MVEIKKGDFVRISSIGFVGQVVDGYTKRPTRLVHVFGMAEETGSVYSSDLEKIDESEFDGEKSALYDRFGRQGQWSKKEVEFQENKRKKMDRL